MASKAKIKKVYVDTGAFIAFLDASDSYHPLFANLFADPPRLYSTTLVLAEAHGWFLKRYDTYKAEQFLSFIESLEQHKVLTWLDLDKKDLEASKKLLRKFRDQSLTLADAAGLWLMKKERIKLAWSVDRHLGLTGVPLVIY